MVIRPVTDILLAWFMRDETFFSILSTGYLVLQSFVPMTIVISPCVFASILDMVFNKSPVLAPPKDFTMRDSEFGFILRSIESPITISGLHGAVPDFGDSDKEICSLEFNLVTSCVFTAESERTCDTRSALDITSVLTVSLSACVAWLSAVSMPSNLVHAPHVLTGLSTALCDTCGPGSGAGACMSSESEDTGVCITGGCGGAEGAGACMSGESEDAGVCITGGCRGAEGNMPGDGEYTGGCITDGYRGAESCERREREGANDSMLKGEMGAIFDGSGGAEGMAAACESKGVEGCMSECVEGFMHECAVDCMPGECECTADCMPVESECTVDCMPGVSKCTAGCMT